VSQGAGSETISSLVAGFELQAVSGPAPSCSTTVTVGCVSFPDQRSADIKYVGSTVTPPSADGSTPGMLYFAVSTQGPWRTEVGSQEFDVLIDTNGDGIADAVLINTRFFGQEVFVSQLVDSNGNPLPNAQPQPINTQLGNVDTAEFNSDTLVLPVATSDLPGISPTHPRIRYGVVSFAVDSPGPIDSIGLNPDLTLNSQSLSIDTTRPGLTVSGSGGGLLLNDQPHTALVVTRDPQAYAADGGLGVLMVHFHNKDGNKAQIIALQPDDTALAVAPATRSAGQFSATLTRASNGAPIPGQVVTFTVPGLFGPTTLCSSVTDTKGVATCHGTVPLTSLLSFNYNASFAGTSVYRASQGTARLT
jgi:hypothetical protein